MTKGKKVTKERNGNKNQKETFKVLEDIVNKSLNLTFSIFIW